MVLPAPSPCPGAFVQKSGDKVSAGPEADLEPSDLRQVWEELEELFGVGQDFYSFTE